MPRNETILHLRRAHVQGRHVLNSTPPILASGSWPPNPSPLTQTGQQVGTQFAFGHHVERVVDGLVRHPLLRLLGIQAFHRAGHLFGRPTLPKKVLNHAKENCLLTQLRRLAPLKASGPCPISRKRGIVGLTLNTVPDHFTADRTRGPLQGSGHRSETGTLTVHQHHRRPFFRLQVFVLFSHRNTLHGRGVALGS